MKTRTPANPAALAWMLVLGHEARATAEDEREVRAMTDDELYAIIEAGEYENTEQHTARIAENIKRKIAFLEGQVDDAVARIAELEAQLAAAQERERENVRLLAECNRILDAEFPYSTRSLRAEIAAALAAAQQEGR